MAESHKDLKITSEEWEAFLDDFQQTLDKFKVPAAEQAGLKAIDHRDAVTDFGLPDGTFFNCAFVHLITTATLGRLRVLYPETLRGPTVSAEHYRRDRERREGVHGEGKSSR